MWTGINRTVSRSPEVSVSHTVIRGYVRDILYSGWSNCIEISSGDLPSSECIPSKTFKFFSRGSAVPHRHRRAKSPVFFPAGRRAVVIARIAYQSSKAGGYHYFPRISQPTWILMCVYIYLRPQLVRIDCTVVWITTIRIIQHYSIWRFPPKKFGTALADCFLGRQMGRHCEAVKLTFCHSERDGGGRPQKRSHCSL